MSYRQSREDVKAKVDQRKNRESLISTVIYVYLIKRDIFFIFLLSSLDLGFVSYNLQLLAELCQVLRSLESLEDGLHQGVNTAAQLIIQQTGQARLELRAKFLC